MKETNLAWKGLILEYDGGVVYQNLWLKLKVHQEVKINCCSLKGKKDEHTREYGHKRGDINEFNTFSISLTEEITEENG